MNDFGVTPNDWLKSKVLIINDDIERLEKELEQLDKKMVSLSDFRESVLSDLAKANSLLGQYEEAIDLVETKRRFKR